MNAPDDVVGRLVLPRSDNFPARGAERALDSTVPGEVSLELRDPVVRVAARNVAVLRAAVPEAAVNEHGDAPAAEDDVRPHLKTVESEWIVDTEAQPPGVKRPTDGPLGLGVAPWVAGHPLGDGRVVRDRVGQGGQLGRPSQLLLAPLASTGAEPGAGMVLLLAAQLEVAVRHALGRLGRRAVVA
jgi:hypothetical protein